MFKKILTFTAFFALVACSEDIPQKMEGQNEEDLKERLKSRSDTSGGIKPFTYTPGYESPWDFNAAPNIDVRHFLDTPLFNDGIVVRVTPYIGLAYYDGADDGTYNVPSGGSYNLSSGTYPNLYNNGNEYGNYIPANPIVMGGWTPPLSGTHEISVYLGGHCPVFTAFTYWYNPHGIYFDVMNNHIIQPAAAGLGVTPVPFSATIQEAQLLNDYGKVVYFKVEFGLNATTFSETVYVLALEADDRSDPSWDPISIGVDSFGGDMYYNQNSFEIVTDPNSLGGIIERSGNPISSPLSPTNFFVIDTYYDAPLSPAVIWLYIHKQ